MADRLLTIEVNGVPVTRRAPEHYTLLRWLRDAAGIFDVKYGCGEGVCGACTVLVDGTAMTACIVLAAQVEGSSVTTAAGLAAAGRFDELRNAFVDHGAAQCGFCTPGMLVTVAEAMDRGELDAGTDVRELIGGNLCRCTGYQAIVSAVVSVAAGRGERL